jgi:ABC-type branched-subunit amino acid transport system substrate-binding protein
MFRLFVLLLTLAIYCTSQSNGTVNVKIGIILPFTRPEAIWKVIYQGGLDAINMALNDAQANGALTKANITFVIKDSYSRNDRGAGTGTSIFQTIAMIQEGVVGVIGDGRSDQTIQNALLTSKFSIPQCSFTAGASQLSNKNDYPFFYRTLGAKTRTIEALGFFIKSMGWTKVAFLYTDNALGQSYVSPFSSIAQKLGLTTLVNLAIPDGLDISQNPKLDVVLKLLSDSKAKIIISVGTSPQIAQMYLKAHYQYKLFGDDYVHISNNPIYDELAPLIGTKTTLADVKFMLQGHLTSMDIGDNEMFPWNNEFTERWNRTFGVKAPPNSQHAYVCAASMFAGFHKLAQASGNETKFLNDLNSGKIGSALNYSLFDIKFDSPLGPVKYDVNGDFIGISGIRNYYDVPSVRVVGYVDSDNNYVKVVDPIFHSYSSAVPLDSAQRVSTNTAVSSPLAVLFIILSGFMIFLCIAMMVLIFRYRESRSIKNIAPISSILMLFGFIIAYLTIFVNIGEPSAMGCNLQVAMPALAFSIIFSNLLAKTWRIYKIFKNVRLQKISYKASKIIMISSIFTAIEIVLLVIWHSIDPLTPFEYSLDPIRYTILCRSSKSDIQTTMQAVLYGYNGLLLAFGVYLAYQTKSVAKAFNESGNIGLAVYNIAVFCVVIIPLLNVQSIYVESLFVLRQLLIFSAATFTFAALFFPVLKRFKEISKPQETTNEKQVSVSLYETKQLNHAPPTTISANLFQILYKESGSNFFQKAMSNWRQGVLYIVNRQIALILKENGQDFICMNIGGLMFEEFPGLLCRLICKNIDVEVQVNDEKTFKALKGFFIKGEEQNTES